MKIQGYKIPAFVKDWNGTPPILVLYGPDEGLARLSMQQMVQRFLAQQQDDPFARLQLTESQLKETPSLLADELNSPSLLGGNRLVIVTDAAGATASALKLVLAAGSVAPGSAVIALAGDLDNRAALRVLAEKETLAAALPCYVEDAGAAANSVRSRFAPYLSPEEARDAALLLAEKSYGNRMVLEQQWQKLALYMANKPRWTLDDVARCIGDTAELVLDQLVAAAALGDLAVLAEALERSQREATAPITLLRAVLRFFMRLEQALQAMQAGAGAEDAMASLRPPVFFKQVPAFKQALQAWQSPGWMGRALTILLEAEQECKTTGADANLLCERALYKLALMQAGRRRAA